MKKVSRLLGAMFACLFLLACSALSSCRQDGTYKALSTSSARGFDLVERNDEKTVFIDAFGQKREIFHGSGKLLPGAYVSPVKRAVCISAPAVPLINALGEIDSVCGVKLPADSWQLPEIRERVESKRIVAVGDGSHEYINPEIMVSLRPDIVYNNIESSGRWLSLLEERNIKILPVFTHKETSLLGQFEWIRLLGEFYNQGNKAGRLFDEKLKSYNELKNRVQGKLPEREHPSVLGAVVYEHRVAVSGGDSVLANTVEDAGGRFLFKDEFLNSESQYIECDPEAFFRKGVDSDVFILTTTKASGIKRIGDITALNDMCRHFKSFKNKNVWCYNLGYWQAVDRPDEVLSDMIAILHPHLMPGHEVRYFDRLP